MRILALSANLLLAGLASLIPGAGAAVDLIAVSSNATGGGSSLALDVPAGTAAGNLLLATLTVKGGSGITVTPPSDWTLVLRTDDSTLVSQVTYWRVATASEPSSHTWSFGSGIHAAGGMVSYSGVHNPSPVDASAGQANALALLSTAPSVTTSQANTRLVALFGVNLGTTALAPDGMTERFDVASTGGLATDQVTTQVSDAAQASAGATGDKTATVASLSTSVAQLIALAPSPGTPHALELLVQPTHAAATATITPAVEVRVLDSSGALVSTATDSVTLAIGTNPSGGTLSGTLEVAAGSGVATFNDLSIDKAGAGYTLAASAAGLVGATSASFTISVGAVSATTTLIDASPASITADGIATSTITVTAKDAGGNSLTAGGDTVTLSATSGSLGSVTDNGDGTYGATFTAATTAGTATISGTVNAVAIVDTAVITLTAGAASGATTLIDASPAALTADGTATSTITATVKDANGNLRTAGGDTIALATTSGSIGSVTDNSDGTYSVTFTAPTTAGTATISGTVNGNAITDTAVLTLVPGAGSATTTLVEVSAATLTADGASTATVTVTVQDGFGNPLATGGLTVTLAATSGSIGAVADNGDGTYAATYTAATTAGAVTISGTLGGLAIVDTAGLTLTAGPASGATSLVEASPVTIAADGAAAATITVALKDANGNALTSGGDTVALSTTAGTLGSVTDNADGTYTALLTSAATPASATVSATVNGNGVTDTATVTFSAAAASAATSTLSSSVASIPANGASVAIITVTLKDASGTQLSAGGDAVTLATTLGSLTSVTDAGNGTYTANLTASAAGTALVTATLNGSPIVANVTVTVSAVGGGGGGGGGGGSPASGAGSATATPADEAAAPPPVIKDVTGSLSVVRVASGNILDWSPVRPTPLGYQLWRHASPWLLVADLNGTTTHHLDSGAAEGARYRVTAYTDRSAAGGWYRTASDATTAPGWGDAQAGSAAVAPAGEDAGTATERAPETARGALILAVLIVGAVLALGVGIGQWLRLRARPAA